MIDLSKLLPRLAQPGRTAVSGVPQGLDAMLLPEIAKAAGKRIVVHVAVDDQRAAVLADQLAYFAPKLAVLRFPAWDCLPYDRVSPNPAIIADQQCVEPLHLTLGIQRQSVDIVDQRVGKGRGWEQRKSQRRHGALDRRHLHFGNLFTSTLVSCRPAPCACSSA